MDTSEVKVFFSINYNTQYGENIIIVGETSDLGSWNPQAGFPLNYHLGGEWSGVAKFSRAQGLIEYKYVVYDTSKNKAVWEEGENRILELRTLKPEKNEIFMKEVWNHREVNVRIKYDCPKGKILALCGDILPLGNWKTPYHMNLVHKKDPLTEKRVSYWQRVFYIKHDQKKLKYRFVLFNPTSGEYIWEREPDRVANFQTLATISPYKNYDTDPNQKDCIKFVRKNNKYIRYDVNFVAEFYFNQITENIYIGPYPQSQVEIEQLYSQGIRGVLNLQTKIDMKYRSIDWSDIKDYYKKFDIKAINFSILDMNADDMAMKAFDAATFLNELITKYKKVYVHCTAGIGRAPHTVASYLLFYENYKIDDAIKLVKEKRVIAYLNRDILIKAEASHKKLCNGLVKSLSFCE